MLLRRYILHKVVDWWIIVETMFYELFCDSVNTKIYLLLGYFIFKIIEAVMISLIHFLVTTGSEEFTRATADSSEITEDETFKTKDIS